MMTTLLPPLTPPLANLGKLSARWADVMRGQQKEAAKDKGADAVAKNTETSAAKLTRIVDLMESQVRKGGNPFAVTRA